MNVTPLRPDGRAESKDRPLPYDADVEQSLLGALMLDNRVYQAVAKVLRPEHFGNALHGRIFTAIGNLVDRRLPATPVTLKGALAQDEGAYLVQIVNAGIPGHAEDYARAVHDVAVQREFIATCEDALAEAYRVDYGRSPTRIIEELTKRLPHVNGAASFEMHDASDIDPTKIPPRGWLLGTTFCRKFISGLIAEGGAGKTAVRYAQYLAAATGRKLTEEHVHHRTRVLIVCLEDDRDEVERRIAAAMLHHNVAPAGLRGWLHYCTPQGLKLLEAGESGSRVVGELYLEVRAKIETLKIDLVSFDPFVKAHGVEENDNNAIDQVCGMLAGLAAEFNCAIDLISHARKGASTPGDAERDRGASAKRDAGRLMRTLTAMSSDDAGLYGLGDQERRTLVRVDDAKINLTAKNAAAMWFRLVGVPLGNRSELYPNGDEVHTAARWYPPDAFAELTTAAINQILDKIEAGPYEGGRYSPAPNATDRAAWPVIQQVCPNLNEKQCKHIIATWLKNGVLVKRDHEDPKDRHPHTSLFVVKRPGNTWEQ